MGLWQSAAGLNRWQAAVTAWCRLDRVKAFLVTMFVPELALAQPPRSASR
jgi:hypothetical protein